jgi:hypothetical protein
MAIDQLYAEDLRVREGCADGDSKGGTLGGSDWIIVWYLFEDSLEVMSVFDAARNGRTMDRSLMSWTRSFPLVFAYLNLSV